MPAHHTPKCKISDVYAWLLPKRPRELKSSPLNGHLLYVEETQSLSEPWLRTTVLLMLPFHLALFELVMAITTV